MIHKHKIKFPINPLWGVVKGVQPTSHHDKEINSIQAQAPIRDILSSVLMLSCRFQGLHSANGDRSGHRRQHHIHIGAKTPHRHGTQ